VRLRVSSIRRLGLLDRALEDSKAGLLRVPDVAELVYATEHSRRDDVAYAEFRNLGMRFDWSHRS
jgi:hypothetical protein